MTASLATTPWIEVPRGAFDGDEPLVAVMRGDDVGSLHRGTFAVATSRGETRLQLGDSAQRVFLRSAAKPFQVMPAVLCGAVERFGLTSRELAVLCASHNAEPRHTDTVLSVLEKIGLPESALACGVHPPLHEVTARQRWQDGREPSPVCNNCSGAHTGMLAACQANGWPVEGYGSPDHPLQQQTLQILAAFSNVRPEEIDLAKDNCHVPAFSLPVCHAAIAFARLATAQGVNEELAQAAHTVREAMTSHPEMVAGENRFDTDLMTGESGQVVAKGGAEGFQGVGIISLGLGLAMKVSDGNSRALAPATMRILDYLGVIGTEGAAALRQYSEPILTDLRDDVVGRLTPVFFFGSRLPTGTGSQ